jgi:aspartyl protease family protein
VTGDDTVRLVWAGCAILLVASSLFGRQLNLGTTLRMALGWVALFALAYGLFLFRDEARGVWSRAVADAGGSAVANVSGGVTRIAMGSDGHFHVRARVNGQPVDFLVDSGATTTGLSADVARRANVAPDSAIDLPIDTANGTVMVSTARIALLEVGNIRQANAKAVIGASFGDTNVLGMSFLSGLKRWNVEGRTLTLQP